MGYGLRLLVPVSATFPDASFFLSGECWEVVGELVEAEVKGFVGLKAEV